MTSLVPPKKKDDNYIARLNAWRDILVTLLGLCLLCSAIVILAVYRLIPSEVVASLLTAVAAWLMKDRAK